MNRRGLLHGGVLVLLLGKAHLARGASIVAVRIWPAPDYSRVTIESDGQLSTRQVVIPAPPRLAVDIDGIDLHPALRELVAKVQADDPYIAGIRVGQNAPGVVRLVIDLKQPVLPQVFTLPPIAAYRHRLVLDLHPQKAVDPLEALIAERLRDAAPPAAQPAPAPAPAAPDPLEELLARQQQRHTPTPAAPAAAEPPARTDRLIIVALDPGHGGEDPGAIGPTGLREKDVVLAIALQLRDTLNTLPGMRVMLTRDGDFFVPLNDRVRKARRVQADLFVSIHADAFVRPQARGASVYALSTRGASSAAARWMAERENKADAVGGVNIAGVNDRQLLAAMADMSTAAQIKDSLKLGAEVLGHIGRVGRLHKAQVEQAGFAVLKAPDIPSILVETAFISNPEEEKRLRDPDYREELVAALATGIQRYFARNPPLSRQRPV
jgi:N-acetylmuramoyl-L-alanine amidase